MSTASGATAEPAPTAGPRAAAARVEQLSGFRVGVTSDRRSQDLITALEVIEHVADPRAFVAALAARLAPGGLLILSTPNATGWSKLLTITLAEGVGRIPRGTHDFDKFIADDEVRPKREPNVCIRLYQIRGIQSS